MLNLVLGSGTGGLTDADEPSIMLSGLDGGDDDDVLIMEFLGEAVGVHLPPGTGSVVSLFTSPFDILFCTQFYS